VAVRRVEVEGDESIRVVEGGPELGAEGSRAGTTRQWRLSPVSAMTTARALATAIKNLQRAVKEIVDRRAGDAEIRKGNFVRKKRRSGTDYTRARYNGAATRMDLFSFPMYGCHHVWPSLDRSFTILSLKL
jgi:hypothetical protein